MKSSRCGIKKKDVSRQSVASSVDDDWHSTPQHRVSEHLIRRESCDSNSANSLVREINALEL